MHCAALIEDGIGHVAFNIYFYKMVDIGDYRNKVFFVFNFYTDGVLHCNEYARHTSSTNDT